jgi:hypothetical protein
MRPRVWVESVVNKVRDPVAERLQGLVVIELGPVVNPWIPGPELESMGYRILNDVSSLYHREAMHCGIGVVQDVLFLSIHVPYHYYEVHITNRGEWFIFIDGKLYSVSSKV